MRILFLSPEVLPVSRVGGLAEYSHDLPLALGELGHQVDIVAPRLRMKPKVEAMLIDQGIRLEVPVSRRWHRAYVQSLPLSDQVTIHLIGHDHLFDREGLYGNSFGDYEDNAERFVFFCRAALELAAKKDKPLDVIHANDWTTGLVPMFVKTLYKEEPVFEKAGCLMTVHNLASMGLFWHYDMPLLGLGWEYFNPEAIEFYGKISFLKAGLVFGDVLSTVSPTYGREILTPEHGHGLEGLLLHRKYKMTAILNGVDYKSWNPANDPALAANYSPDHLDPKAECKQALCKRFGLTIEPGRPLAAYVGRLLDRRGMDILSPTLETLLDMGLGLVIMGQGDDRYQSRLLELAKLHKGSIGVHIGFDTGLERTLISGADMVLLPSRSEPCGMHQLHSLRYGTVPVARATGGLQDTVRDHSSDQGGTGFVFHKYCAKDFMAAMKRALDAFDQKEQWREIMRRGMTQDFSWDASLPKYIDLYERAQAARLGQGGV